MRWIFTVLAALGACGDHLPGSDAAVDGPADSGPEDRGRCDGCAITLTAAQQLPLDVVVDEVNAYWSNYLGGTIMKAPLAGGVAITLAEGQGGPIGVIADETTVYWTSNSDGTVMKVPKGGG